MNQDLIVKLENKEKLNFNLKIKDNIIDDDIIDKRLLEKLIKKYDDVLENFKDKEYLKFLFFITKPTYYFKFYKGAYNQLNDYYKKYINNQSITYINNNNNIPMQIKIILNKLKTNLLNKNILVISKNILYLKNFINILKDINSNIKKFKFIKLYENKNYEFGNIDKKHYSVNISDEEKYKEFIYYSYHQNDIDDKYLKYKKKQDYIFLDIFLNNNYILKNLISVEDLKKQINIYDKYYQNKNNFIQSFLNIGSNTSLLLIKTLILSLKCLNEKGCLIIIFTGLLNVFIHQIIIILNYLFEKKKKKKNNLLPYHFYQLQVLCKNYTYNENIIKNLEQIYNKINSNKIKHNVKLYKYNYEFKGINNYSIIDNKIDNNIKYFNNSIIINSINYFDDLIFINKSKNKSKSIILILQENLKSAIQICKQYTIKINPIYLEEKYKNKFILNLLGELISTIETINYNFPNFSNNNLEIINSKINNKGFLDNLIKDFNYYGKLFETRDLSNYKEIKNLTRYFEKTLNKKITRLTNSHINGRDISRAWLKMYEILDTFNIIPNKTKINTFHACEAPGNFILAFNHYIKTKTNVKEFNWHAQSYYPNAKIADNHESLGDYYGMIKKYKYRWDFGKDGTGDITNTENIEYYHKKYNDLDVISLDCGLNWTVGYVNKESKELGNKILFCQIIFILRILRKNGNGLVKLKVDNVGNPSILSLLCIILTRFENVYYYKPFPNPWTGEFYIIMKNYINVLTDKEFIIIEKFINNYNSNEELVDLNNITNDIKITIFTAIKKLIKRNIFYIKRNIYYLDTWNKVTEKDLDKLKKEIERKDIQWIEKFKVKKINNNDKL